MRSHRVRGPTLPAGALLAAALLLAGARARAEPFLLPLEKEGAWAASDRQVHAAASFAIAASLRVEGRTRAEAIGITFGVGIAKEVYDATIKPRSLGRGASRKDLVADLLGAAAGLLLVVALER